MEKKVRLFSYWKQTIENIISFTASVLPIQPHQKEKKKNLNQ